MKRLDYVICSLLMIVAFFSRAPLIEKYQSHWDGPQYSIALVQYSFIQQTPAPPGYPLYIGLGNFFYLFTHNPHLSMLAVSVLGSIFGVSVIYIVGLKTLHRNVGIAAAFIFLTGSSFYYFSLTPYAYGLLPGLIILLAYSVYKIVIKKEIDGILFGISFGILFGIRPQEFIQIGPLFLLGFFFLPIKEKMKSLLVIFLITIVWFIPLSYAIGVKNFFILSYGFGKSAIFNNSFLQHIELIEKGLLLSVGPSIAFLFYGLYEIVNNHTQLKKNIKLLLFFAVWIVPGLSYNLFVRTEHAGYQMSYLSAILILIAWSMWKMMKKKQLLFFAIISLVSLFNLYWFFYNRDPQFTKPYRPTSFHYSDIRKNDLKVGSKVTEIIKNFDPQNTVIITTTTLWRPFMYHLKDYHIIALGGLDTKTPGYNTTRYDATGWIMRQYDNTSYSVVIPQNTTDIIFTDDDAAQWVKSKVTNNILLPGNSRISVIHVLPQQKIIYGYHSVKFVSR